MALYPLTLHERLFVNGRGMRISKHLLGSFATLSVCLLLSVCLSVSICLSLFCLSVCLSHCPAAYVCLCLNVFLYVPLLLLISLQLSFTLALSVCLCLSLSVF